MAAEAADVLIKKGKRATAAYIQGVCSSQNNSDITNEVFDSILNPLVPINDWDSIDWCKWLLAGGRTPEDYTQTVQRYDNATTCGLVWTANFVAYRCRTCGISPCMSLCSECFQRGDHKGHDFNMFRSQAGGACDCGDKSVMKESGFCQRHGLQNQRNKPEAPPDLLCVAEVLMPRLFLRLVQHLRENSEPAFSDTHHTAMHFADGFLSLLQSHSEMGAAMRSVMTQALTNPQIYYMLAVDCEAGNHIQHRRESLSHYLNARNSLQSTDEDISTTDEFSSTWYTAEHLRQSSFLDELVFWTIKFEFPQKLVCLLLNMMPDLNYKEAFTKIFVKHYSLISIMLSKSKDSETLSNRVVHVSVQLFSNEDLAYQMTKDYDLLQIMVDSLFSMMLSISQKSTLQCPEKNEHLIVDCSHHIMKEHCYWPLVSDLNNVLTHAAVAHEFLSHSCLLNQWFKFLSLFQGMNVNQRELKAHVEFESNTYYAAFSAELEASATPMWALISHLKNAEMLEKTKAVLDACLGALQKWFTAINFVLGDEINPYQVSFHIPLHRCYASFLGQAVRHQGAQLDTLLPPDDILKLMLMHPLQAQVTFHEILCNMWVRSGLQIKGQAMTYIQCHFCNSIVDADLFLLQLCAMKLDPDWFLKTVMQRFHVWEWLTFHPNRNNMFLDSDKVMPMLEGALSFLTTLLSTHTNIGLTEEKVIRQEMVSLLCMNDRTHSQLMDLIPDKCGETSQNKNFETILSQVAVYKAPNFEANGAMMQGTYVPKPEIWEKEYDPIHVLLRAVHRREYQASLDRFAQYLRQNNKLSSSRPPWPPFRIPPPVFDQFQDPRRILHCKTMHGIIFTILYRAVNDPDIPEQILSFCIYLLDMAVRFPSPEFSPTKESESKEVDDLLYDSWFNSSNIFQNISKTIDSVVITEKVVMSMKMVEEMEVDEEVEEEEMEMGLDGYTVYDVPSPIVEEEFQDASTQHPSLPATDTQLALPSTSAVTTAAATTSSNYAQLVPFSGATNGMPSTSSASSASGSSGAQDSTRKQLALPSNSSSYNMALIPTSEGLTTVRPKCMKLKQVPGRHRMLLTDKGLPLAIGSCEADRCSSEQRYHLFSNKRTINVHESILSLLLQLHSKLSEKPDSYKPKENACFEELNSRIGDGVLFVERLLNQVVISGGDNFKAIQSVRQKLWPKKIDVNASPSSENVDKEERRRRAKERQQKLMAEFASKQKAFMQKTMETDCKEGTSGIEEVDEDIQKEYECVICSQMSASEEDRPVGMVVLLQATSVAGHYHEAGDRVLPCDEKDLGDLLKGENMAAVVKNKIELLERYFNNRHWPMALNIGWEGGVHVQTCGHYLHIDCHKAYILSLKNQNQLSSRLQNLAVEQGEYYCPLCRQLANSVIPLRPGYQGASAVVKYPRKDLRILASEISDLLSTPLSERDSNLLKKYMGGIMEDITNATYPQYRSLCAPNPSSLFLFVCSIARTNLEIELVQRGRLFEPLRKKSCFVPLLNVLYLHSRLLSQTIDKSQQMDYAVKVWSRLTGQIPDDQNSLTFFTVEVPLFLRDPIAILLQIILTLPTNLDKSYYRCVVQVLYNFILIQSLVQISCRINSSDRYELSYWAVQMLDVIEVCTDDEKNEELDMKMKDTKALLGYVISCMKYSCLYLEDDEMDSSKCISNIEREYLEQCIHEHCLHFLKIAALLQSHLFEEKMNLKADDDEFYFFCQFLGLSNLPQPEFSAASCIEWSVSDPRDLIKTWCEDYLQFISLSVIAARRLLQTHIQWCPPALLLLPHNYDDIFKYYHKKPCTVCHSEPKDPSLCLICGTMVCLRENCCRQLAHFEAVSHSVTCGAGTAIYLAVNSSTIIVIRGKRACLWGSVYLDSYGEEDRDLKRGKPLFLSEERYSLLQQQWINHSFDHTNKRWVWHKDNL